MIRAVPSKETSELPLLVSQLGILSQEIEVPRNWDTRLYARSVVLQRQVNLDITLPGADGRRRLSFLENTKILIGSQLVYDQLFFRLSFRGLVSQSTVLS